MFSRLPAVNRFFFFAKFPFHDFFVLLLSSPPPPPSIPFPNGPSLIGLVFILAKCPPTPRPIVCWGGSLRNQPKERLRRIGG